MQTTEGEQIAQLIAGYIDIILKKVRATTTACLLPYPHSRSCGSGDLSFWE